MRIFYLFSIELTLFFLCRCNHQHPTPYENQSFFWELVKRFERNIFIDSLFFQESGQ